MRGLPRELSQNSPGVVSERSVTSGSAARYFDYASALALRSLAAHYGTAMPRYLLAPEVALLLDAERDQRKRLLIETFWNTGGRLNEVLPLTRRTSCWMARTGAHSMRLSWCCIP